MAINYLILYCLVEGQSASNAFYVNAKPTEAVYDLKVHIKTENPNTFIRVDVKDLTLWRILIPSGNLRSAITVNALDDDMTGLDNLRKRLSEVFPKSPDDNTYILVRRPSSVRSPPVNGYYISQKRPTADELDLPAYKKIRITERWQ